jgi:hypothetical protein
MNPRRGQRTAPGQLPRTVPDAGDHYLRLEEAQAHKDAIQPGRLQQRASKGMAAYSLQGERAREKITMRPVVGPVQKRSKAPTNTGS